MSGRKKYLVLSDSHGETDRLERILLAAKYGEPLCGVLHLGDGFHDLDRFESLLPPIVRVKGNCDFWSAAPGENTLVTNVEGVPMLLTHGHLLGVRQGIEGLLYAAFSKGCRAALYGHTHVQRMQWESGILLLNPGAVLDGRYAFLYIHSNGALEAELK